MIDRIPAQTWLALVIACLAAPAVIYVVRHFIHDPARRDITQPPEDLAWRSGRKFAASLLAIAGAVALTIFIFTPEAERLAQSSLLLPTVLAGAGSVILKIAFDGLRTGVAAPLLTGTLLNFDREVAPREYWGSMAWNVVLGATLLLVSPQTWQETRTQPCFLDPDDGDADEGIEACNLALSQSSSRSERALALRSRGIWREKAGEPSAALADLDRSLEADNTKPESYYRRGKLHAANGRPLLAKEDFNSALLLDPDHVDALFEHGLLALRDGNMYRAIEDFDRADDLRPNDPWTLANRGLAHAWARQIPAAERDLAAAESLDRDNYVAAHGRVVVSLARDDYADARLRLRTIVERDSRDQWARNTLAKLDARPNQEARSGSQSN